MFVSSETTSNQERAVLGSMPCPGLDDLRRFLAGQISDADAEPIEGHLKRCASCVASLHALQTEDTFVAAFRSPSASTELPADDVMDQLMKRLAQMDPPTAAPLLERRAALARETDSRTRDTWEEEEWRKVLAPPQQSGEIGRLGPYRVLRLLGRGGMGMVFEAEDPHL